MSWGIHYPVVQHWRSWPVAPLLYLYWCWCWKSRGSSYKAWVSGIPYGCTPNLGCGGSKGRTHLTLLLLENWWHHMPHSPGHGNCILSLLAWCASQRSRCWNSRNSRSVRLWIQRNWGGCTMKYLMILPLLLGEVITCYLLWICRVLSWLCGFPMHWSKWRHHANRDLLLYILSPSSYTTFAATEMSPVRIFWVSAKSLWSGTADTLSVCCIVVNNFGPSGCVGVDLDSWLLAAWRFPVGPALVTAPAAFTGGDCPDPTSHCQYQSGSTH